MTVGPRCTLREVQPGDARALAAAEAALDDRGKRTASLSKARPQAA